MLVSDFDYDLPKELISQQPPADRAGARMLVVRRAEGRWEDRCFRDLPLFVEAGDCLVLNDTRVFPSRLFGTRSGGTAKVEIFLIRALSDDQKVWQALVRPGRKLPEGERIRFSDTLTAEIVGRSEHGERTIRFELAGDLHAELEQLGHMPLPPYIRRSDSPEDRTRYNTVYAEKSGSVAAPTAGLHFTREILERCADAGAAIQSVTLHVGPGTFSPVYVETLDDVRLHSELYSVTQQTVDAIRAGTRRICVGTTVVRTLETVYRTGELTGETSLFVRPGFRFLATDVMLTNFHLPKSSLLMLVSALAGRELILNAYRYAVQQRYRFFSYGDCMLILP